MIADTVIAPDRPDTLIRVRESLDAGCFVGMLGDRVFGADKTTQCQFLGRACHFPGRPGFACCHDALPCDFVLRSLPRRESLRNLLRTFCRRDRVWIGSIAPRRFSSGCSATSRGSSIMRVLRLTTGSTFIRSGIKQGELRLNTRIDTNHSDSLKIENLSHLSCVSWGPDCNRIVQSCVMANDMRSTKRKFAR